MKTGREALRFWPLDPTFTHLNHGTVGAVPLRVLRAQRTLQDEIESNPAKFMLRELLPLVGDRTDSRVRTASNTIATFLGAKGYACGFARNVTTAISAVLRSLAFEPNDEILVFDETYGAITLGAGLIASSRGARVVVTSVDNPHDTNAWHRTLSKALAQPLLGKTRLVILDHVTSSSAAVLNLGPLVDQCHAAGALVMVDGAHAPGAIPVDIAALNCDYYACNLHKWLWTPRSCGFLAVHPRAAEKTHATVSSWGLGKGLQAELDWEGTYDPTPMLATGDALDLMHELGLGSIYQYNHDLAWRAYQRLSSLAPQPYGAREASIGTMAAFFLPQAMGSTKEHAARIRDIFFHEHRTELHLSVVRERLLARVSAQVYVDENDMEKVCQIIAHWKA
jgi:isopenicillin-N epimerase